MARLIQPLGNGTTVYLPISFEKLLAIVLDNNKLLTLSNRERLNLPDKVQKNFKVKSLNTPPLQLEDAVTPDMFYQNHLKSARYVALDAIEDNSLLIQPHGHRGDSIGEISANLITQGNITKILAPHFETNGLVTHALNYAASDHSGLDMPPLHKPGASLIDYNVQVSSGDWVAWQSSVGIVDIDTHQVPDSDVVIPTLDTVRHEDVLYSWLSEHKPLMLCGPLCS
ncbi:hypothetical protein BY996DRAFT_6425589 [Phakopsora pachyrhizi]|nr:hypothetical protein BY996DRAFT_6425589 [Phakopsora pachyrhizi]